MKCLIHFVFSVKLSTECLSVWIEWTWIGFHAKPCQLSGINAVQFNLNRPTPLSALAHKHMHMLCYARQSLLVHSNYWIYLSHSRTEYTNSHHPATQTSANQCDWRQCHFICHTKIAWITNVMKSSDARRSTKHQLFDALSTTAERCCVSSFVVCVITVCARDIVCVFWKLAERERESRREKSELKATK